MKLIDISHPINIRRVVWPGSTPYTFQFSCNYPEQVNRSSYFTIDSHFSTHIDAPSHFINGGLTIDNIGLETCVGLADVINVGTAKIISAALLEKSNVPDDCQRLLLQTSNSNLSDEVFFEEFACLDESGANWVVQKGIKLVGIDYLSVQGFFDGPEVHQILLGSEVVIIESLNLKHVHPGRYTLIALPLKLDGLEASPTRAVLIDNK